MKEADNEAAPERIWVDVVGRHATTAVSWDATEVKGQPPAYGNVGEWVEYVRADIAKARVAAKDNDTSGKGIADSR